MSKTIVFCADGTWNAPQAQTGVSPLDDVDAHGEITTAGAVTNVVKLFANLAGNVTPETLALLNEQEKVLADHTGAVVQVAKYIHGVGDSKNLLIKLLGGAFGVGVVNRVVRGYTFVSRQYAEGDAIHITGFSRGAYTARALAGMIGAVGLLNPNTYDVDDKDAAYRLGIAAWCKAKRATFDGNLSKIGNALLTLLEDVVAAELKPNSLRPNVPIESVAVWDTVGSLGVPEYTDAGRLDILRFTDATLGGNVRHGFHAMAIDELRRDFPVTKWNPDGRIEQVWFVGAHCDVGGGYALTDAYFSDIALSWMMKKLATSVAPAAAVKFAAPLPYMPNPQPLGGNVHTPWEDPPFNFVERSARHVEATDMLHTSVQQRWNSPLEYRPQSMSAFMAGGLGGARFDPTLYA